MLRACVLLALYVLPFVTARCTKTHTTYTTITAGTRTTSSTYPVTTVTHYSSTVLIGTPYAGPNPFPYPHPPVPINCAYYTGTDIPPPPSSAPASSVNPPPPASSGDIQARGPEPAICRTIQTTVTVEYLCVETINIAPPPIQTHSKGVLTTRVPDFCAQPPKRSTGEVPAGDKVFPLSYPYFANTAVECCVYCSEQYKNLVASGFIPSGLECDCLVNRATDYSGKSKFCPRGIQPYALGVHQGHALLGACGKAP